VITFKIAWRNLWRNSKRTFITMTAMVLSTIVLIVSYALMLGMMDDMQHSITDISVGQAQVHHPRYLLERSIYDMISNPQQILEKARSAGIEASPRAFGFGLLSSGSKSAGVQFWGIDPILERSTGEMAKYLLKGTYLPDHAGLSIVLGRKLARTLNADIGTELVVVVQAADGSLGNELFLVSGIMKGIGETLDRSLALIHRDDFADLFVFPDRFHEIALNSKNTLTPDEITSFISQVSGDNEVKTWHELMPGVSDMLDVWKGGMLIFLAIFFLAAGLGVLNTMLMATFERIPEIGLLKAIGTTPWRILREISAEAFLLGILSSLIGGLIGTALSVYFQHYPIDLSRFAEGFSMSGTAFSANVSATVTISGIIWPVVLMWLVSFLAALYPAIKAARLDPVRAMTHV